MKHENTMSRARLCALMVWVVAAAFGCFGRVDQDETPIARQRVTSFPVVVAITTPRLVAVTAPVVVGSNSVSLGARADVVTGMTVSMGSAGLATQPDAFLNETWSRGTAALNQRVTVRGTLHAKTRTLDMGATVTTWDQNPAFDPPNSLSYVVNYPSGPADAITLQQNESRTLSPGKYGAVTLNSQSTLTLRTGTYFLSSLIVNSASVVKLDQVAGPVVVYATDDFALRGTFTPLTGAAPDLALIHLGTNALFVESVFNGAIVAPWASITLRSVTSIHSGYFAAKDVILDAGARVQYRAPLALIGAAGQPGATCRALLAGKVPDSELYKYCNCRSDADSDRDGVEDCVDGCPYDPLKTAPGTCNCGVPETDTDGDKVPDCLDACRRDRNNVSTGQCGCQAQDGPGALAPAPANTPCTDSGCPQTGSTCNGAGVCGNRSACVPATGCTFVNFERSSYWICPGPVTQSAAVAACKSKQMALLQIDNHSENQFVRGLLKSPVWFGANSITTSGTWRWSTPTSNDGTQFWAGGATGAQRNKLFSSWASGAPATQRCAVIRPEDGRWLDLDCSQALGFICEYPAPPKPMQPKVPTGGPDPAPARTTACVSESTARLPANTTAGFNQLKNDVMLANRSPSVFGGAAASPPPNNGASNCVDVTASNAIGDVAHRAGCGFTRSATQPTPACRSNADCTGTNAVCRQVKDDPNCVPTDTVACVGHSLCGTLSCPAPETATCQQFEVCNPGSDFTPTLDPGSTLTPETFSPGAIFGGALPTVTPAPTYVDPSNTASGKNHPWCFMNSQRPVAEAHQPEKNKQAKAGSSSPISFGFEPDLVFDANVNPLALGETNLSLHAQALLGVSVTLNNFIDSGKNFTFNILKANADLKAERCTIRDDDSEFVVFGLDFIDQIGVPIFNTSDKNSEWYSTTKACNEAVGEFVTAANRAKKAFRDAQQLLKQYHALKSLPQPHQLGDLCQQLVELFGGDAEVPFFPGGIDCGENEPPEITINRFIDYYQAPGFGQISRLRDATSKLKSMTAALKQALSWSQERVFANNEISESETVLNVQFFIGPVPMVLQVDAFYSYGVAGSFKVGLEFPFDPLNVRKGARSDIATVKASVMPHASAGLSAFVGAGTDLGAFSATVGIEGTLKLGDVRAPIFAGAGIGAEITDDIRPIPDDLKPPISLAASAVGLDTHIGIPKAFKFYVWYNYGAALVANDVLKGDINARLRVKFAFFSRTWRKRVIHYDGLPPFRYDLFNDKSGGDPSVTLGPQTLDEKSGSITTQVANGTNDVGYAESQTPLAVLVPLAVPVEPSAEPITPASLNELEQVLYDRLCCSQPNDRCPLAGTVPVAGGPTPCCPGIACQPDPDGGGRCVGACTPLGESCTDAMQCCSQGAKTLKGCAQGVCTSCVIAGTTTHSGGACTQNSDCCGSEKSPPTTKCDNGECAIIIL